LVGFVNGPPLVVIELKMPGARARGVRREPKELQQSNRRLTTAISTVEVEVPQLFCKRQAKFPCQTGSIDAIGMVTGLFGGFRLVGQSGVDLLELALHFNGFLKNASERDLQQVVFPDGGLVCAPEVGHELVGGQGGFEHFFGMGHHGLGSPRLGSEHGFEFRERG
jgi:hypothetical protein